MSAFEIDGVARELRAQQEQGRGAGEAVAALRLEADRSIAQALARELGIGFSTLESVQPAAAALVTEELAMDAPLSPVSVSAGQLTFACVDPTDGRLHDRLRKMCGLPVQAVVAARMDIERIGLERLFAGTIAHLLDEDRDSLLLRLDPQGDEPIVALQVRCPSTGHRHLLRVPPLTASCQEAVAWTFDVRPGAYRPLRES